MHGQLVLLYHLQTYAKLLHQFCNHWLPMLLQFLVFSQNELKINLKLNFFKFFGKLFHIPLSNRILLLFLKSYLKEL